MRSPTTIASSTTIPSTKINAITVIVEMVISNIGRKASVPSRATGIPTATHIAILNFKNRVRMIKTKTRPPPAFLRRTVILSLSSSEVSIQISRLISSGRRFLNFSTISLVSRAICIRSSFPTCDTLTTTPRTPLNSAARSPSSKVSLMVAMSFKVTLVPSVLVTITTSSNSSPQ